MVHVHGLMMCAAEHTAVPMQLASHGYLCIVPDMMDQTAPWTTNKDGNDIWFQNDVMKKGTVEDISNDQKKRYEQRLTEVKAIGREIKENGFLSSLGLNGGTPTLDSDRLIISGQSMGGWTSILATCGDQDIFKVCLTHDAAFP